MEAPNPGLMSLVSMLLQAARQLSGALHLCPWSLPLRVTLAGAAIATSPGSAPAARRLCSDPRLGALAPLKSPVRHPAPHRQTTGLPDHGEPAPPEAPAGAVVQAALLARAAGAIGLGPVAGRAATLAESKVPMTYPTP